MTRKRICSQAMDQLQGSEKVILQAIVDSPRDSAGYVEETKIAEATRTAIQDVRIG